jgi:alkaline phosphatase
MCSKSINFCVFSDLHSERYSDIYSKLANDIASIIEQDNIQFIINLGDTVGAAAEKSCAIEVLKNVTETFGVLSIDKHYVIGNHDLELLTKEEFNNITLSARKKCYYSFDCGLFHFVVLDMNYHENGDSFASGDFEWFNAFLPWDELLWLKNDLKQNANKSTFIFTHQNLDDRKKDNALHPEIISNANEIRNIFESAGNVLAVFQGHGHKEAKKIINGIEYFSIASSQAEPIFTIVNCSSRKLTTRTYRWACKL